MSKKKPGRKPSTDWILVGFDMNGIEIARIDGITEKEANERLGHYPRGSIMKREFTGRKVMCGVEDCSNIAVTMVRPSTLKEAVPVCRYHSCSFIAIFKIPGFKRFEGIEIKNKLVLKSVGMAVAPDALCIRYCPSYYRGECRAMKEPVNREHARILSKAFRGMTILCVEDHWWRK